MRYVDNNKFINTWFYRVVRMDNQPDNKVKIEVVQGGVAYYTEAGEVEEKADILRLSFMKQRLKQAFYTSMVCCLWHAWSPVRQMEILLL